MIGGSADLTGSNNTKTSSTKPLNRNDYSGRYIYYGIREFGMSAAMNGMALHGGVIPYGGTFLVFSDYCRGAIRLSALQRQRVVYVMTHDSIGLGEDGPTHQPIEHLQPLRAMPNLLVMRPADAVETAECWAIALAQDSRPTLLALTRQNLPPLRHDVTENLCLKGGYRLRSAAAARKVVLVATGSEVSLALDVAEKLEAAGQGADVVSMVSTELFDEQDAAYQADLLPDDALIVSIEAGTTFGWERYTGRHGLRFGIDSFGASAPIDDLYRHFGLTVDAITPRFWHGSAHKTGRHLPQKGLTDMAVKVAINGFGRIGRNVARAILERTDHDLELVSINDLGDAKANARLLRHDSVHGAFNGTVEVDGNDLIINGKRIQVTAERDPAALPHAANGVDIVMECTGFFTNKAGGQKHLDAGAKRVLISAPAKEVDLTVVYGVNDSQITADHRIISNASCTTNCLAPFAKVLHEAIGIERGLMTTIHAYTNDQKILDQIHDDPRRARAAAMSMIPTSTGAAVAVGLVLPELKGKLDGSSIRVPTPNVSVVDLTFTPSRETTKEEVNAVLKAAAEGALKGVLGYTEEPLVSIDFNHNAASSTIDSLETAVIDGKLVRVLSWYDNEWGFSNRMIDTAGVIAKFL